MRKRRGAVGNAYGRHYTDNADAAGRSYRYAGADARPDPDANRQAYAQPDAFSHAQPQPHPQPDALSHAGAHHLAPA